MGTWSRRLEVKEHAAAWLGAPRSGNVERGAAFGQVRRVACIRDASFH